MRSLKRWFDAKSFQIQLIILAVTLDLLGFVAGYLLAPSVGVEPILGGVYGLLIASIPTSLHVMRVASKR